MRKTTGRTQTFVVCLAVGVVVLASPPARAQGTPSNPVLFVTQVPVGGFTTVTSTFGNQLASMDSAPRGGDLVIRYADGSLRSLTAEAGYGSAGMQGANAIAVREPCVHWSGDKALFSMIVGAPTHQYQVGSFHWQIYEVSGLTQGETATIRRIENQPANFNNVSPIYATDGRILFTSDRPPSGAAHLYPQRDEYESAFVVAGIYSLDESTGDLRLVEHSPSGSFSLSLDSFGRVIFTKWDHLQRDQQGDAPDTAAIYRAFTVASEASDATKTTVLTGAEVFPEPRSTEDPAYSPLLARHTFNHFFPWEINEDGTAEETINHVGRHELGGTYTDSSFVGDPNLTYYVDENLHANRLRIRGDGGLFHLREDPVVAGDFLATYAPEFGTGTGGTLLRLSAAPSLNAEDMVLTAVTPTSDDAQVPEETGYFRNPLPMSDGTLIAAHTPATGQLTNLGSTTAPDWSYQYRLKILGEQNGFFAPVANLTNGIEKTLSWWTPDQLASYDGPLWELDPVEVVARPEPQPRVSELPDIEARVFDDEDVEVEAFRAYLRDNDLALIVSRNVTQRDRADRQQPFNLRVPGGVSSVATAGTVYDVAYLQLFQGDAVRGYGAVQDPNPGRRLLARPMHEPAVSQAAGGPPGAVAIAADGSVAALVPARRAMSWQLTDVGGNGVVRERNWLSFQPGEIRVCASCHGVNKLSQTGDPAPTNEPEALHELLALWKETNGSASGCGQPASTGAQPLASDALQVLRAAVGLYACRACVCDVDDSLQITAGDALMTLKKAVGQPVGLTCPACAATTTTTVSGSTSTTTSGSGSTTTVPAPTTSTVTTSTTPVAPPSSTTTASVAASTTTTVTVIGGLFEASNPWNEDIESMAASAQSGAIIQTLEDAGGWGTGTLRIDFSIHLLEANASTPRKTFSELAGYYTPDCDPSFAFPVPVNGAIEGHTTYSCNAQTEDCHLLVVERDEKRLYELYGANIASGVLSARCGVIWDLTRAYGSELRGEQCTSADAAGLPIGALLFTADEVAAGEIPHAIRFILPNARMRKGVYVHPATHAGAPSGVGSYPPYGVRFRLRADYPIESLTNANARVIARAMQKYGMILSDGGNIALTAASDRYSVHTWDELGIDSYALADLQVSDFEVVDLGTPITLTYDCVRAD